MRFITHLPLLGCNPSLRSSPVALAAVLANTRNASRLSGIHAGLRRSERARPQGASPKKEIRQAPGDEPYLSPAERRRARELARKNAPTYKIRKGKKDITEKPGPRRVSYAGRLADPRDPLGKHSLLKKFKTGQLVEELRAADKDSNNGLLQHNDFARQMVLGEVEKLMDSRKVPSPKKGQKRSWESVPEAGRRAAREEREGRSGRSEHDKWGPRHEDKFDRLNGSSRDAESSRDGGRFNQDRRDRETTRGGARFDRSDRYGADKESPRGGARFDRSDRYGADKESPRGGARFDRSDRYGADKESPRGGARFDRSDRYGADKESPRGGARFDRSDRYGADKESPRAEDRFDRSNGDRRDAPVREDRFERPSRDRRDAPMREDRVERPSRDRRDAPMREDRVERLDRDRRDAPMREDRVERLDRDRRDAPMREDRVERPNRDRRDVPVREYSPVKTSLSERTYDDTQDNNVDEVEDTAGVHEISDKKKKKYEPPTSIIYTTAASQFLYGTSTVEAALHSSRRQLYKFYIYQGTNRRNHEKDEYLTELAWKRGVKVEFLEESGLPMLNKMSDSRPHNGYVLEASPLPQLPVTGLGRVSADQSLPGFRVSLGHQSTEEARVNGTADFIITEPSVHKPFVLLLDQVLDPGNLGAILRTASFMGVTAVAVAKRGASAVTPVVLKASAGAAETMTIFSVNSVVDFVKESKENGWRVYTAVPPKKEPGRHQADLRSVENSDPLLKNPCILVLGSEGEGLSRQLRRAADFEVSIPNMSGSRDVESLNVSVAAGLLCAAFAKGKTLAASNGVEDAGALF